MPDTGLKNQDHDIDDALTTPPKNSTQVFAPDNKPDDERGWFKFYENSSFNKLICSPIDADKIEPYKGQFKYESNGITFYSPNPDTLKQVDCLCLLTFINMLRDLYRGIEGTEISVKDYMQRFHIPDRSNARKYLANSIDTLGNLMVELYYTTHQGERRTMKVNILGAYEPLQRGVARYHLNEDLIKFMTSLNNNMYGRLPDTINEIKDTDSLALLYMLCMSTRMNGTKTRYTLTIPVKSLIEATSFKEKYEKIVKRVGGLQQRIIDPFEKKLDSLRAYVNIKWEYCHQDSTPLTEEELRKNSYKDFISRYIRFTISDYPISTLPDTKTDKRIPNGNSKKKAQGASKKTTD